jgi:hypothetical protein
MASFLSARLNYFGCESVEEIPDMLAAIEDRDAICILPFVITLHIAIGEKNRFGKSEWARRFSHLEAGLLCNRPGIPGVAVSVLRVCLRRSELLLGILAFV